MNEPALFTVEDLYQLGWLEDPRISPDGRFIAFVRVLVDQANNRYRRAIWLAPTDGSPPRRFTAGTHRDTSPRWNAASSQLAFVSTRVGDQPQIYVISATGGEARKLTALPHGATNPVWNPNGTQIAFLSQVNAEERAAEDSGETELVSLDDWERKQIEARRQHNEEQRYDPRVVAKLPYRSGTEFFDDRHSHVYVLELPADPEADLPAPRRLTDGDINYAAPVWMPDGQSLLSTASRDPEADSLFAYYELLQIPVPPTGRGAAKILTAAGFSYENPLPAPNGRLIAVQRQPEDRLLAAGARIAILSADGDTAPYDITADTDLNVEHFRWLPDSSGVLYGANWRGEEAIYYAAAAAKAGDTTSYNVAPVFPAKQRIISEFDIGPDGHIAFVAATPDNPCELYLRHSDGRESQLTSINASLLTQRTVVATHEIVYPAPDGRNVQGWLLYPPHFNPDAQSYPLVVYIHGGPHTMWGPATRSMWHEWQTAAAHGYVVFFCNPRGSEGYGEFWRDAIHSQWGVADAPDILAGIDAVIARGGIDPKRIGVTGGSYGGYMTVWLIAQSPDRFASAVAARGVYNLLSEHSTSDAHELIEIEFSGYPWELHEQLWQHSPLAHAHKITTPLRLLHSEQDYRVPISEAEQLFAILRRRKQVVELVRYPREGHELTRSGEPRHRADHMRRTLEWLDRYCKIEDAQGTAGTE